MKLLAALAVGALAFAQTSPHFEVASIHANPGGNEDSALNFPRTGRLTAANVTLRTLSLSAYGVQNDQLSGGPKWLDSDRYDVEAKTVAPLSESEKQPLLQSLLSDRFHLRIHSEKRELVSCPNGS